MARPAKAIRSAAPRRQPSKSPTAGARASGAPVVREALSTRVTSRGPAGVASSGSGRRPEVAEDAAAVASPYLVGGSIRQGDPGAQVGHGGASSGGGCGGPADDTAQRAPRPQEVSAGRVVGSAREDGSAVVVAGPCRRCVVVVGGAVWCRGAVAAGGGRVGDRAGGRGGAGVGGDGDGGGRRRRSHGGGRRRSRVGARAAPAAGQAGGDDPGHDTWRRRSSRATMEATGTTSRCGGHGPQPLPSTCDVGMVAGSPGSE